MDLVEYIEKPTFVLSLGQLEEITAMRILHKVYANSLFLISKFFFRSVKHFLIQVAD